MKKSSIIFGSNSELKAYEAIDKHLPEGWRLYANTPLSQIVEIKKEELTEKKWNFYLKSSVDFVLANAAHEPVLAIEFDGLSEGFSSGKTYILNKDVENDPYRGLKMNFKINTCYAVGLPLIVISFEEINSFTSDEFLSVVNSIIGMYIASREYKETIEKWDREGRGRGKSFDQRLWEICELKTQLSFRNDPFLSHLEANWEEFKKLGASWSRNSLSKPDQMTAMRNKKTFDSVGCRYVVKGGKLKVPVIMTVWVRNFAGEEMDYNLDSDFIPSHGVNPLAIAENIAWYLGQKKQ